MRGHEASKWYSERRQEAIALSADYRQLAVETRQRCASVREELKQARMSLAGAYLSDLSEDMIQRVQRITGFKGLSRRHPVRAMEREAKRLRARIAEIQRDEQYVRRQWLVGPQGELTQSRSEAQEMLEPWQKAAARFESLKGFMDLIESGYDTTEFQHDFWEASYWRRWAAGDRICEQLGMDDFGDDVLPEYRRVAVVRDKWTTEVQRWDDRISQVHSLVQEHDRGVARLPRLPEIYLEHSHTVIASFLEHADLSLLEQWSLNETPPDRAIQMGLRRVAGLTAKVQFIEALLEQGLVRAAGDFLQRAEKYGRKATKFARSKHTYSQISQRDIDHKFLAKQPRYHQRLHKLNKLVGLLESYDDYSRFELSNEPELWWLEMTRKRPTSLTPGLQRWYQRNAEARPNHDPSMSIEDAIAGAVAEAVSQDDDLGYLS